MAFDRFGFSFSGSKPRDDDEDASFSFKGEDDSVFGGGDGDDSDAQLDQILSEMGKDFFGKGDHSLELPRDVDSMVGPLAEILRNGVRHAILGDGAQRLANFLQKPMEWLSDKVASWTAPGDIEEISAAILSNREFGNWFDLGENERDTLEKQKALIHQAITVSAWPGIDMATDDAIWKAWKSSDTLPQGLADIVSALFTQDLPGMVLAALAENDLFANLGLSPEASDQLLNKRAMQLWVASKVMDVDGAMANAISEHGRELVAEYAQETFNIHDTGPAPREADLADEVNADRVMAPTQALETSGWNLPPPEQVLAAGYGVSIIGSLMGIF